MRVRWREEVNDLCRMLISRLIVLAGFILHLRHRIRLRAFSLRQRSLRRRFALQEVTSQPLPEPTDPSIPVALTSGSTGCPKRVAYPARRLIRVRWIFMDHFARAYLWLGIRRTSIYVFGPFSRDGSLTSLLLQEERPAGYLATLQGPHRVHTHPSFQDLRTHYTPEALRLFVIAVSNPGVLYATNPSTLTTFFESLRADWNRHSRLIRDLLSGSDRCPPSAWKLYARLCSRGSRERLRRLAAARNFPPMRLVAPSLQAYSCWTGGYVGPFLDHLERDLPSHSYHSLPMISMSTETVQTLAHFGSGEIQFLPLAPGVYYEFLEVSDEAEGEDFLKPSELRLGGLYNMVVSDVYGLRRYRTDDLFQCRGRVGGLPDLHFMRRSGLSYSFTGEKLTSGQLEEVFAQLRLEFPEVCDASHLAAIPSYPEGNPVPCYRLCIVGGDCAIPGRILDTVARRADRLMGDGNIEYAAKRRGGRLGPARCGWMTVRHFIGLLEGVSQAPPQFKFLPLYRRTWEQLTAPRRVA